MTGDQEMNRIPSNEGDDLDAVGFGSTGSPDPASRERRGGPGAHAGKPRRRGPRLTENRATIWASVIGAVATITAAAVTVCLSSGTTPGKSAPAATAPSATASPTALAAHPAASTTLPSNALSGPLARGQDYDVAIGMNYQGQSYNLQIPAGNSAVIPLDTKYYINNSTAKGTPIQLDPSNGSGNSDTRDFRIHACSQTGKYGSFFIAANGQTFSYDGTTSVANTSNALLFLVSAIRTAPQSAAYLNLIASYQYSDCAYPQQKAWQVSWQGDGYLLENGSGCLAASPGGSPGVIMESCDPKSTRQIWTLKKTPGSS